MPVVCPRKAGKTIACYKTLIIEREKNNVAVVCGSLELIRDVQKYFILNVVSVYTV